MLQIKNLKASVEGKEILQGLNLSIGAGEVHAIMGPNGSGKSTLANVLAGREDYDVNGEVVYDGENILELSPEDRARKGLFLAFQYPIEIPGVSNANFLKTLAGNVTGSRSRLAQAFRAKPRELLHEPAKSSPS